MLADGGPDLERVLIAGLFELLGVDGGVVATFPDVGVAGVDLGGAQSCVDLLRF